MMDHEKPNEALTTRSIFDVYVAKDDCFGKIKLPLYPEEYSREVQNAGSSKVKQQKYTAWKLLETAVNSSFQKDIKELCFQKSSYGKWTACGLFFSIAHTDGYVSVAVSDRPVGIDAENFRVFTEKFKNRDDRLKKLALKVCCCAELNLHSRTSDSLIELWTKKESIYKCFLNGSFSPSKIDTASYETLTFKSFSDELIVSVCGESIDSCAFFLVNNSRIL